MQTLIQWGMAHPYKILAFLKSVDYVVCVLIGGMPMPSTSSSGFYRYAFNVLNVLAANPFRVGASLGPAGQQPPKP